MEASKPLKLRKWHFLFLGCALVFLAVLLWYWNWRTIGLPSPLQPEHYLTLASYVLGIFIFGLFIYRLTKNQLTIMLLGLILVNVFGALMTSWIDRNYQELFVWLAPTGIPITDTAYIAEWRQFFLMPAVYSIHAGLLLLWAESLVMFLVRRPSDEPG